MSEQKPQAASEGIVGQSASTGGLAGAVEAERKCECRQCLRDRDEHVGGWPAELTRMILCPKCGNKRCPHATDHRHECTGSNEPGQKGSAYENCKPANA